MKSITNMELNDEIIITNQGKPQRDKYVYRQCKLRMGKQAMADFMYATIMCRARIVNTLGIGIYDLHRNSNAQHHVDVMLHIPSTMVHEFEKLSGRALKEPVRATVNNQSFLGLPSGRELNHKT